MNNLLSDVVKEVINNLEKMGFTKFTSEDVRRRFPFNIMGSDSYLAFCIKKSGYTYNRIRKIWEPANPNWSNKDRDIADLYIHLNEILAVISNPNEYILPTNTLIKHCVEVSQNALGRIENKLNTYKKAAKLFLRKWFCSFFLSFRRKNRTLCDTSCEAGEFRLY